MLTTDTSSQGGAKIFGRMQIASLLGRSENSTEVQVPAGWTRRSLASVGHIPSSRSVIVVMNETPPT